MFNLSINLSDKAIISKKLSQLKRYSICKDDKCEYILYEMLKSMLILEKKVYKQTKEYGEVDLTVKGVDLYYRNFLYHLNKLKSYIDLSDIEIIVKKGVYLKVRDFNNEIIMIGISEEEIKEK